MRDVERGRQAYDSVGTVVLVDEASLLDPAVDLQVPEQYKHSGSALLISGS